MNCHIYLVHFDRLETNKAMSGFDFGWMLIQFRAHIMSVLAQLVKESNDALLGGITFLKIVQKSFFSRLSFPVDYWRFIPFTLDGLILYGIVDRRI